MSSITVKVVSKQDKAGDEYWEGTVALPGLTGGKLVRRSDNSTRFASAASLGQAARNLARNLGFEVEIVRPEAKGKKTGKRAKCCKSPCATTAWTE